MRRVKKNCRLARWRGAELKKKVRRKAARKKKHAAWNNKMMVFRL